MGYPELCDLWELSTEMEENLALSQGVYRGWVVEKG